MDARELRIGNWVYIPSTDQKAKISLLTQGFSDNEFISLISVNKDVIGIGGLTTKDIEPIPLTEQWLERFGFVKDKIDYTYYKGDFEICLPNFFKWKDSVLNKVDSVHYLQNLYHALTGQELKLKEQ